MTAKSVTAESHRAELLQPGIEADRARLRDLRADRAVEVIDTLSRQLGDFLRTQSPSRRMSSDEVAAAISSHLDGRAADDYGVWVHYPWARRLVHLLPEPEFRSLRSDRNRHKITPEEQARLGRTRIGVVGLSVGHAVLTSLALEGIGGQYRLADFDALDLSNLNRLHAGVHELGVNKAVLAARHLAEIDPFLTVEIYPDGITDDNLESFLGADADLLDLLVEECDDLAMKLALREQARARRIPVIMETSDRGTLDVERFDREPERAILHGLLGDVTSHELRGLTTVEKVPYAVAILGIESQSAEIRASLLEIQNSISTWPQLASAVQLGGAVSADAARRILLGTFTESGRFRVDIPDLVRDGAAEQTEIVRLDIDRVPEAHAPRPLPSAPAAASGGMSDAEFEFLVGCGALAPSGGNNQPWAFSRDRDTIHCYLDRARGQSFLDVDSTASYVALGACLENVVIAAASRGLRATVTEFPGSEPDLVWSARLTREPPTGEYPAVELLAARNTNRRIGTGAPLPPDLDSQLAAAAEAVGGRALLVDDRATLEKLGEIVGACDRLRFLSDHMREDLYSEVRFSGEEVLATRDGLDLATLEISRADLAGMLVIRSNEVMARVRQIGGGDALADPARDGMRGASGAVLILHDRRDDGGFLAGGRAMQRVWLALAEAGLAVHPQGVCNFLFERLERGGLTPAEAETLTALRRDYDPLFGLVGGEARIMLLRIAHAGPPSALSLRRRVADVVRR